MYKGEPTQGMKFFTLLVESEEFTSELGKVALNAGKLEAELIIFLKHFRIKGNYKRATLGTLIDLAEKNNLLDKNIIIALRETAKQRNYITHNIYALFVDLIDETIMEKSSLLDSDVQLYFDRAWQLKENLGHLADIIKEKNLIEK
jgi:hypothetical protein